MTSKCSTMIVAQRLNFTCLTFGYLLLLVLSLSPISAQVSAENQVIEVAWSPDGTKIAAVYQDNHVNVYSADNLDNAVTTFSPEIIQKFRWTPDGKYIVCHTGCKI